MSRLVILAALATTACVSEAFVSVEGGFVIGGDSGSDSAVETDAADNRDGAAIDAAADTPTADATTGDASVADASDGCATISGAAACNNIMNAYCQALYACNGGQTVMQCRTWFNTNYPATYDCGAGKFQKSVCSGNANKCAGDIPGFFCSKLMNNYPATLSAECTNFFAEF